MAEERLVTTTVTDLAVGQSGTIVDLTGTRVQRLKLLDLGLTPGTRVSVRKIAPLADPIEVAVRSYMLTLRKAEAEMVTVVVDLDNDASNAAASEAIERADAE